MLLCEEPRGVTKLYTETLCNARMKDGQLYVKEPDRLTRAAKEVARFADFISE